MSWRDRYASWWMRTARRNHWKALLFARETAGQAVNETDACAVEIAFDDPVAAGLARAEVVTLRAELEHERARLDAISEQLETARQTVDLLFTLMEARQRGAVVTEPGWQEKRH